MRIHSRRSVLSAFGIAFPFGLGTRAASSAGPADSEPVLRFRPFEEAVREAFADGNDTSPCRRVEVGHSPAVTAGLQGCHNERPFAGFPAGSLRIVRAGTEPGPVCRGVRLYVATVEVAHTGGCPTDLPSRPLDFATLPPAPIVW